MNKVALGVDKMIEFDEYKIQIEELKELSKELGVSL